MDLLGGRVSFLDEAERRGWPRTQEAYTAPMWPATAWDDEVNATNPAQVWTVMSRVRERQQKLRTQACRSLWLQGAGARRRLAAGESLSDEDYAASKLCYEDVVAQWHGAQSALAFLFAPPDSAAMEMLDARGEYFDIRTGDTWDLFFPGYYRSYRSISDARPVGHRFGRDLYFQPAGFDHLRWHIEHSSGGRWYYSGGTDLVLVNVYLPGLGEPTVDWESTISGQVTDATAGIRTLTIANIVERITRDLEAALEDPNYGVGDVTDGTPAVRDHRAIRDFMINALGGIAAALGARAMGI